MLLLVFHVIWPQRNFLREDAWTFFRSRPVLIKLANYAYLRNTRLCPRHILFHLLLSQFKTPTSVFNQGEASRELMGEIRRLWKAVLRTLGTPPLAQEWAVWSKPTWDFTRPTSNTNIYQTCSHLLNDPPFRPFPCFYPIVLLPNCKPGPTVI